MVFYNLQQCLKHYNYNVESVINAVLENNLPCNLKELDKTLPLLSSDPMVTNNKIVFIL